MWRPRGATQKKKRERNEPGERAEDPLDDVQLVDLRLAGEDGLPVDELAHDAPDGPHVDRVVVGRRPEQKLGRSVPPRGHVVREVGHVPHRHHAGEAEVAQLRRGGRRGSGGEWGAGKRGSSGGVGGGGVVVVGVVVSAVADGRSRSDSTSSTSSSARAWR